MPFTYVIFGTAQGQNYHWHITIFLMRIMMLMGISFKIMSLLYCAAIDQKTGVKKLLSAQWIAPRAGGFCRSLRLCPLMAA
jgi:hypothetical protein